MPKRKKIEVKGIVQGVGFRPFVYRLANQLNLKGFVRNTTSGVEIEIEGAAANTGRFLEDLRTNAPPAARIDEISVDNVTSKGYTKFSILESKRALGFTQISPDIATCNDCLYEMYDRKDRRYRFPFINCTNCGPRYSIITETPYDREKTSMSGFKMCPACGREFRTVKDRRFHAQPDCCSVCGPHYVLYAIARKNAAHRAKRIETPYPILETATLLKKGKIVAIKGIGGFHIACDATHCDTVRQLRRLKHRPSKPFAIMAEIDNLDDIVHCNNNEKKLLKSFIAPIMLLRKRQSIICEEVSPKNPYLGVMVPYTPVHYLLLEHIPYLIMTSANIQDEPIVHRGTDVVEKIGSMVSFCLDHNRAIENRCDDSVGFYLTGRGFSIIRRSRGYAPIPIGLPNTVRPTLAVGPYLKNTFTLARTKEAYVSPHIGDLDNLQTLQFFHEMVEKYKNWFWIEPELIVHDLHPDYQSTKFAKQIPGPKIGVQHHIAHFASCLGENNVTNKTIGIIFDGTGYGLDGKIWGGEFFVGDLTEQQRVAHLQYLPLPGGESSIRKPYRIAVAYVHHLLGKTLRIAPSSETRIIQRMIEQNRNLAYTSSMGRLFDCISAILGVTSEITYEAEAAINLEYTATTGVKGSYPYRIIVGDPLVIEVRDTLDAILKDKRKRISNGIISAKFHNTIVAFSLDVAGNLRKKHRTKQVCFSGGVFQNRYLLNLMIKRFEASGFRVFTHHLLPTNDGCISYGQVIAGNSKFRT
jgi:hydrogenase maturation protein HypF